MAVDTRRVVLVAGALAHRVALLPTDSFAVDHTEQRNGIELNGDGWGGGDSCWQSGESEIAVEKCATLGKYRNSNTHEHWTLLRGMQRGQIPHAVSVVSIAVTETQECEEERRLGRFRRLESDAVGTLFDAAACNNGNRSHRRLVRSGANLSFAVQRKRTKRVKSSALTFSQCDEYRSQRKSFG